MKIELATLRDLISSTQRHLSAVRRRTRVLRLAWAARLLSRIDICRILKRSLSPSLFSI